MKANVGGVDKRLRVGLGVALVAWAAMGGPPWAWLGVVPLLTGVFNFCPLYAVLGMSTRKARP